MWHRIIDIYTLKKMYQQRYSTRKQQLQQICYQFHSKPIHKFYVILFDCDLKYPSLTSTNRKTTLEGRPCTFALKLCRKSN